MDFKKVYTKVYNTFHLSPSPRGGTPLQGANRDVLLDGVAFSRLE